MPPPRTALTPTDPQWLNALQQDLYEQHRIETPVYTWPHAPQRLLRVAAQLYNDRSQYERLAGLLPAVL